MTCFDFFSRFVDGIYVSVTQNYAIYIINEMRMNIREENTMNLLLSEFGFENFEYHVRLILMR